jgi:hypothetical protein
MCIQNFGAEVLRIEDLGEDGRIILKLDIQETSPVINCRVPQNAANFLTG